MTTIVSHKKQKGLWTEDGSKKIKIKASHIGLRASNQKARSHGYDSTEMFSVHTRVSDEDTSFAENKKVGGPKTEVKKIKIKASDRRLRASNQKTQI